MSFLGDFGPSKIFGKDGAIADLGNDLASVVNPAVFGVLDPTVGKALDVAGKVLDAPLIKFSSEKLGVKFNVTLTEVLGAAIATAAGVGIYGIETAPVALAGPIGAPAPFGAATTAATAGAAAAAGTGVGITGAAVGAGTGLLGLATAGVTAVGGAIKAKETAAVTTSLALYALVGIAIIYMAGRS